ncbi:MAG TPA: DUF1778 domain-containing protein [Ktedonobacterales bacterium]|nr:DUF1778 domain-containing protein [Ktedonobacterales bacterium]
MTSTKARGRDSAKSNRLGKSERLAARLSPDQKQILARAAALKHEPLSQFLVNSAMSVAADTIRQHEMIELSAHDSAVVMRSLLNPEPAGQELRRVADRYNAFMREQPAEK